jgi:heterodisulfide reductase subunit A-like polyferredoxin
VFLCGGALGPVDIAEAVTQAIAASLKAVTESVAVAETETESTNEGAT